MAGERSKEKLSDGEILADEIEKAQRFAGLGMYEQFSEEEFPNLHEKDTAKFGLYLILALKTQYDLITTARSLISSDEESFKILNQERKDIEGIAADVVKNLYPDVNVSDIDSLPIFLGGEEARVELSFWLDLGMPELVNKDNFSSIVRMGESNIERLKEIATKRGEESENWTAKREPYGLLNGETASKPKVSKNGKM